MLAELQPERFSRAVRSKLGDEIESLKRLKLAWLKKNRKPAIAWEKEARKKLPRGRQEAPKPFRASLPDEVKLSPDDKVPLFVGEIEAEIKMITGKLAGANALQLVLADFLYGKLEPTLHGKGNRIKGSDNENPRQGFQVLRWAVFQHIGEIGGDKAVLQQTLKNLAGVYPLVKDNMQEILADCKRIIELRRAWLADVLHRLDESGKSADMFTFPKELGIETAEGVLPTGVEITRKMRNALEFEMQILGESNTTVSNLLPKGAQGRAILLMGAQAILATLDDSLTRQLTDDN